MFMDCGGPMDCCHWWLMSVGGVAGRWRHYLGVVLSESLSFGKALNYEYFKVIIITYLRNNRLAIDGSRLRIGYTPLLIIDSL